MLQLQMVKLLNRKQTELDHWLIRSGAWSREKVFVNRVHCEGEQEQALTLGGVGMVKLAFPRT